MRDPDHVREYLADVTVANIYIRRLLKWLQKDFGKPKATQVVPTVRNMFHVASANGGAERAYLYDHLFVLKFCLASPTIMQAKAIQRVSVKGLRALSEQEVGDLLSHLELDRFAVAFTQHAVSCL